MYDALYLIASSAWAAVAVVFQAAFNFINNSANVIAACAFWLTLQESRRNSTAVVRVIKSGFSYHRDQSGSTRRFIVRLKNHGISLHDITVFLVFKKADGFGELSLQLTPLGTDSLLRGGARPGEFARGMVCECKWQFTDDGPFDEHTFKMFATAQPESCRIRVDSQGFTAAEIRPRNWLLQWPRDIWNRFAWFVNLRFGRQTRTRESGEKQNVFIEYLPRFDHDFDWAAKQFVEECQSRVEKMNQVPQTPSGE